MLVLMIWTVCLMSKKSNDESKGGDRHYHNNIHVIENNILRKNLLGMCTFWSMITRVYEDIQIKQLKPVVPFKIV